MRMLAARLLAVLVTLTWLVFPGFGPIDLGVSWDANWPVVLEAGWGVFMTLLLGGSFLAVAAMPTRAAPATITLVAALAALLVSAVAGLDWELLGYAALLGLQVVAVLLLVPGRERVRPLRRATSRPLLGLAVVGAAPLLSAAARMFRLNRGDAGESIGELTMGVDHHAVQGALALTLAALALVAAVWPRGRRLVGTSAGLSAAYVGLVSFAFPGAWAGFSPPWSALGTVWGAATAGLSVAAPRPLQPSELGGEVVEAERAL